MNTILALVPWSLVIPSLVALFATTLIPGLLTTLKINASSKGQADLQTAIQNALYYGMSRLHVSGISASQVPGDDTLIQNLITLAQDYLNDNAESLLEHLDLSGNALAKAIEAQVLTVANSYTWQHGQIVATAAASPPAPPAPASALPTIIGTMAAPAAPATVQAS